MTKHVQHLLEQKSPILIDGGLSNVLETKGCDLNHPLWTAKLLSENPEILVDTHLVYIKSGAQVIATASYQASFPGLIALGYTERQAKDLMLKSVKLVQRAIEKAKEEQIDTRLTWIAASLGPYGAYLADGSEYQGNYGVSNEVLRNFHSNRWKVFENSEVDLLAFETIPSLEEAQVISELVRNGTKPSWVSFSCKDHEHLNDGTALADAIKIFQDHPSVFALGINCTHPKYISKLIQVIKSNSGKKIVVYPNSGEVYDAVTKTWEKTDEPRSYAELAQKWIAEGADLIGGCCRIGPKHIQTLNDQMID